MRPTPFEGFASSAWLAVLRAGEIVRSLPIRLLIGVAELEVGARDVAALRSPSYADLIAFETVPLADVSVRARVARPDVVLLVLTPVHEEIAALLVQLQEASPASRTLILCDSCTRESIVEAVCHGAAGYVTRPVETGLLVKAVQTLYLGGDWFGRTDLLQALRSLVNPGLGVPVVEQVLTDREQQVLNLAGCGLSNKAIGRRLGISDQTVKTHLHRVYVKLKLSGRYRAFQAQPGARIVALPPKISNMRH